MSTDRIKFTDEQLLYSATARCKCGAGLAYPINHDDAMKIRAWVCAKLLKGEVAGLAGSQHPPMFGVPAASQPHEHEAFDWAFFKIREETSVNNIGAHTTRPAGTVARHVGCAKCPKCEHAWESEPYSAAETQRHWMSGPCSKCGYAVGANGTYSSSEGKPIDNRARTVVLAAPEADRK